MSELCRVSLDELNNDPPCSWAHEMEQIRELDQKHRELVVLLLTGWEDRLQDYLEEKYNDEDLYPQYAFLFAHENGDDRDAVDLYLNHALDDDFMRFIEREARILASVIMG